MDKMEKERTGMLDDWVGDDQRGVVQIDTGWRWNLLRGYENFGISSADNALHKDSFVMYSFK